MVDFPDPVTCRQDHAERFVRGLHEYFLLCCREPKIAQCERPDVFREETHDDLLAIDDRDDRDADVHGFFAALPPDRSVLGGEVFINPHVSRDLDAVHDPFIEFFWNPSGFMHHAVHAETNDDNFLLRFEVNIRCAELHRVTEDFLDDFRRHLLMLLENFPETGVERLPVEREC